MVIGEDGDRMALVQSHVLVDHKQDIELVIIPRQLMEENHVLDLTELQELVIQTNVQVSLIFYFKISLEARILRYKI